MIWSKTRVALVGGGRACHELLTMIQADPQRFGLMVMGVADPDPDAPGLKYAREIGIEAVVTDYRELIERGGIDLVVELTGRNDIRDEVFRALPPGAHFIDHYASQFFWDLFALAEEGKRLTHKTEQRVLAERNRLRHILDSLPFEVLVIGKDYHVQLANRTFLEANGLSLDSVVGKCCYDIEQKSRPACDITVGGCPHNETLLAGRSVYTVVSRVDEEGGEHFATVRAAPIRDEKGTVLGVVETVMDITQRVNTEEKLKETRARLNQFIDTAPLFIFMKGVNLRFRVINRHALETLGLRENEVIGQTGYAVFPEEVARQFQNWERTALQTGKTVRGEGVMPVQDRNMFFSATLFPVRKDEEVIGVFGLIEDITELRESERKLLRRSEELSETQKELHEVLENSRDLIFMTDTEGLVTFVNPEAERVLGHSHDDAAGTPAHELCSRPEEFQKLFNQAMAEGHALHYEMELLRQDGEKAICNVSLTTINDQSGNPKEVVGICRDITTRMKLKDDLVRSERLAAIGKMAAGVAHEINNPLAVLETISGVLEDTLEDEIESLQPASRDMMEKAISRMRFQIKRCTNITHSLLGFARKSTSGRTAVDLTDLLEKSLNLLTAEIKLLDVEICREYQEALPRPESDPMLLQQIFVNLLKNATDAIDEKDEVRGIITLRIARVEDCVEVSIQDNGIGIPQEELGKIFDLFHTSKPVGKGTGLGLAIVHDIANRLGAEIRVASEVGKWTRFTLAIPLRPEGSREPS